MHVMYEYVRVCACVSYVSIGFCSTVWLVPPIQLSPAVSLCVFMAVEVVCESWWRANIVLCVNHWEQSLQVKPVCARVSPAAGSAGALRGWSVALLGAVAVSVL